MGQMVVFRKEMQAMVFLPLILITRGALMRGTHPFLHLMRAALSAGGMIPYYTRLR